MNINTYKIARLFLDHLPTRLKRNLNKMYNFDTQAAIFNIYTQQNSPICLVFNSGEKKPGCLTVGYEPRCDIRLERNNYARLNIPDNSIDYIYLNLFLEKLDNDEYLWEFFRELGRLIKDTGKIEISFLDLDAILSQKKIIENFWNLRKRFMYSKKAAVFNSPLSYIPDCKRIVDYKTIEKIANLQGFDTDKKSIKNKSFIKSLIVSKNPTKNRQWMLTNTLPNKGEIVQDSPVYLFDCDSSLVLESFNNIDTSKLENRNFLSVIGSMFFLNLIPLVKPSTITLFDINSLQIRYMKLIIKLIETSDNFQEFIENLFSRKYNKDVQKFLSQPYNKKVSIRTRKIINDKKIYDLTIAKIRDAKYVLIDGKVPALKIDGNSMCQHLTIINKELFKPGPRINVINLSSGLAKHYAYIKSKIISAEIVESALEDEKLVNQLSNNGLMYVSNIGEEDWLRGSQSNFTAEELGQNNIIDAFERQWIASVKGFKKFISLSTDNVNFWIIDSLGNIFSKQDLLLERSDSHEWLWEKVKKKIVGNCVEVIHMQKGKWGFKEYLETINYKKFINSKSKHDTVVLHILLGNGVSLDEYLDVLHRAATSSKRIIVLEHDRDSVNFGPFSSFNIVDIRRLLKIIRSDQIIGKSEISVQWAGAGRRIDKLLYDNIQNFNRNIIITIDL